MIRRLTLLLAVLSFTTLVGCGLLSVQPTPLADRPGAVTRVFESPMPRVLEAMRDSIGEDRIDYVTPLDLSILFDSEKLPKGVVYNKKDDDFVFDPEQLEVESMVIEGKSKDGRHLSVLIKSLDQFKKCELTILIGKKGDLPRSEDYFNSVTDRLAHPIVRTPEEIENRKIRISIGFAIKPAMKADNSPTDRP